MRQGSHPKALMSMTLLVPASRGREYPSSLWGVCVFSARAIVSNVYVGASLLDISVYFYGVCDLLTEPTLSVGGCWTAVSLTSSVRLMTQVCACFKKDLTITEQAYAGEFRAPNTCDGLERCNFLVCFPIHLSVVILFTVFAAVWMGAKFHDLHCFLLPDTNSFDKELA